MRKPLFLCLMAVTIFHVQAQDYCQDDVVENLNADIQFSQLQVHLTWDFNAPPNPNCPVVCPPLAVYYDVEVDFGSRTQGPSGPITWFQSNAYSNHLQMDTMSVHEFDQPFTSKFEYVRFRVRIDGCADWEDWVMTSIWN